MDIKTYIDEIPDFPKPGIVFKDFSPLLRSPKAWSYVISKFSEIAKELNPDVVVGIESRGFIVGSSLATASGLGFVPVRKPGKLPGTVFGVEYELEYGLDRLEVSKNAFQENQRVLLVDDLLATGGTANATINLMKNCNVEIVGIAFIIELTALNGRKNINTKVPIKSIVSYS